MNLIKIFLFMFISLPVMASGSVSFSLYDVALPDLVRVVVDDIAQESLVMSSDAIGDKKPVSFVLRNVSVNNAMDNLKSVVKERGFELVKVHGVYHLRKSVDLDQDVFVYIPKYRSVAYLSDLIGGILPRQVVASQRQLPNNALQGQGQGPGHAQSLSHGGFESGTNVNSLIDKGDKDSLVIKAKPDELALVKKMLIEVDRPIPEMLIKAVVMEVQTGGVEGSALNLLANLVSKGVNLASLSWNGGADAKNALTVRVGGIESIWSAINSDSRFKVVSAPQVRVKSGSLARFSVGSDTPVLGSVSYQGNGQSVQSVEYKQSGVILELKPEIRGLLAELKVMQQLSSFAKTETGVNGSPTLLKRELSTSVIVAKNDVVLLGGLDEQKTQADSAGLFFMPDFMRSRSGSNSRSEIVLMLYVESVRSFDVAI